MSKVFELSVYDSAQQIDNYVLSSDMEETVDEFLDMYADIVFDLFRDCGLDEKAERISNKMINRDCDVELECDGETEYVLITVNI